VVGLAWSNDPESYAGGSDATGMASRAWTKRDILVLRLGVGLEADHLTL